MTVVFIIIGIVVGGLIGFMAAKIKTTASFMAEKEMLTNKLAAGTASLEVANQTIAEKNTVIENEEEKYKNLQAEFSKLTAELAVATSKLQTQEKTIAELGEKFNTEFENIANKILDTKTTKFTELNKTNLSTILEPLSKNITEFQKQVHEVYDKESKERFSLGEKVKELAALNQVISDEALI
jgi:DNA recombination protein RmuC